MTRTIRSDQPTGTALPPTARGPSAPRLAYLDHLRVLLTFLVVAHHSALAYGNLGIWPNWQSPAAPLEALPLDAFVLYNQTYFMGAFFLLSGFLAPSSLDRKGAGRWAGDRLKRLSIPFLGYMVLLRPMYTLPTYLEQPVAERPSYALFYLTEWDPGPAWFLEVLLLFSLVYAALRARRPETIQAPQRPLRRRHFLAFALGLAGVSYLWRLLIPVGDSLLGLPTPAYLPQYILLFVVGIAAYRRGWLHVLPRRSVLLGVVLVIGSFVPMILGGYRTLDVANPVPGADLAHLAFALWDSLFAMGMLLILLSLFQRWFDRPLPLGRFLSQNAFAVYLLHAPVIVGVVALLRPFEATPVAMFLLTFVLAAVLSWALAALVRCIPAVRAVL